MPGGRRLFEDLLDKDEFGFETNNPNSEVTSEKKIVTNADGSSIETIVKNAKNAPSIAAKEAAENPDKVVMEGAGGSTLVDPSQVSAFEEQGFTGSARGNYMKERKIANEERIATEENYQKQISLFDQGLISEKPVDPTPVVSTALKDGEVAPRAQYFKDLRASGEDAKKTSEIEAALASGAITQEQADKALGVVDSEFDTIEDLNAVAAEKEVAATTEQAHERWARDEGELAPEITQEALDAALVTIKDSPEASTIVDKIVAEVDAGKDPKTIFGEIKSFFKDNPVMGQAILSAVAGYVSTGSLWKGLAGGVQGFAGGLETERAQVAATAKAKAERATTIASYVKDGYTQESAQSFIDSNGATELKFSNRKLNEEFAKIQYRAQVKGETAAQKATAAEQENFFKWTAGRAAKLGEHWTDKEREKYNIPDATATVQDSALQFMDVYGLSLSDMEDVTVQTNFAQGLDDWNEYNRQAVNNGNSVVQSPLTFVEERVNRHYATEAGLPLDIFTGENGKVDSEVLAESRNLAQAKARGTDTEDGVSEKDVWNFWHVEFNKENDGELRKQAAKAGMSPFLFWIDINA